LHELEQAKGNKRLTKQEKLAALVAALRARFKREHFTAGEFLAACDSDPVLHNAGKFTFRKSCRHRTAAGVLLKQACGRYGELQLVSAMDTHVKALRFNVAHDSDAADIERETLEADAKEAARKQTYNITRRLTRSFVKHGLPGNEEPVTAEQCLTALRELQQRRHGSQAIVKLLRTVAGAETWQDVQPMFYRSVRKEAIALAAAMAIGGTVDAGTVEALQATAVFNRAAAPPKPVVATGSQPADAALRARVAEIEAELARHGIADVTTADILEIDELRGSPWRFGMSMNPADYRSYTDCRPFQQHNRPRIWSVFDN
jgi:hypothetical protein